MFLDEIADMSPKLQSSLLRVLQEKEITTIGSSKAEKIDVRIIAATNASLQQLVKQGTFREDLYYRINVLPMITTPLRLFDCDSHIDGSTAIILSHRDAASEEAAPAPKRRGRPRKVVTEGEDAAA